MLRTGVARSRVATHFLLFLCAVFIGSSSLAQGERSCTSTQFMDAEAKRWAQMPHSSKFTADAIAGDKTAQWNIGWSLVQVRYPNNGVTGAYQVDFPQGLYLLCKLAAVNDVRALNYIGVIYFDGQHGIPSNHALAASYFSRAAELGNRYSQFNLAEMYELGQGVRQDTQLAIKWFSLASAAGHTLAAARANNLSASVHSSLVSLSLGSQKLKDTARCTAVLFAQLATHRGSEGERHFVRLRTIAADTALYELLAKEIQVSSQLIDWKKAAIVVYESGKRETNGRTALEIDIDYCAKLGFYRGN